MINFPTILKGVTDPWSEEERLGVEAVDTRCSTCIWRMPGGVKCESFPDGIPTIILMGAWDHKYRFEEEELLYTPLVDTQDAVSKEEVFLDDRELIEKLNPHHDEKGRFTTASKSKFVSIGSKFKNSIEKLKNAISNKVITSNDFSAEKFAHSVGGDYSDKTKSVRLKEETLLAKKVLSKEDFKEFMGKLNSLHQDIADGKETYKLHTVDGIYTADRQKEHARIISEVFKNAANAKPAKGETPTFTILGGIGGSGKSKFGEDEAREYDPKKNVVIDSDDIKSRLPGYDPEKAHLFHREAGYILDKALRHARKMGLNTVYDSTMGRPDDRLLQSFKHSGFKTRATYMHISPQESAGRAILRWKGTVNKEGKIVRGRLVPPHVILNMKDNTKNFDITKPHADSWSMWRNDRPKGVGASKVAEGGKPIKKEASFKSMLTN